ncbi:MAG TPA: glycosyltransferase WbuB [Clostridiaceae bacterium]|nr:glycosyltransferase WbuB [Clostridiaceae bacterium]
MKRLWIFNHYAVPPGQGGGTRHYDFAHELISRGYDVTIFASSYNHFNKKDYITDGGSYAIEDIDGVRFLFLRTSPRYEGNGFKRFLNMMSYFIGTLRIYKKMEKPDVVIGSSVHLFACAAAYFVSKFTGAKFICEIRDLWPQTLIDMGAISNNHPVAVFFRFIEKFVYKKAQKIIVLLPLAHEYISRYNISKEKIVYIPNGINIEQFNINAQDLSSNLNIVDKTFFNCIYAGSVGPANKLDNLIHASKIICDNGYEDIRLYLVGDGPEKHKIQRLVQELELDNIKFIDHIDKKYIPNLLINSDIQIFNLKDVDVFKYGISSNKLFDYLCSSKPIVFACKCGNDIISKANAGISIPPENPKAMAEAYISLYKMPKDERERIGQNGLAYVKRYHSIDMLVDKLEGCIN